MWSGEPMDESERLLNKLDLLINRKDHEIQLLKRTIREMYLRQRAFEENSIFISGRGTHG